MLNEEILGRWTHLKSNVQHFWGNSKIASMVQEKFHFKKDNVSPSDINLDNYEYESHRMDDLPLTLMKDPGPGIKYSYTENSEFARGAEKAEAVGLDSFGEKDTFDPDEADDHQDYRNRTHKSDLSDRFYTPGMRNEDLH